MSINQSLEEFSSKALLAIGEFLKTSNPDLLLIQGDTSTVLMGAVAAYYNKIAIGHIEAGLRTGNLFSPWPEEGNRTLVSQLAQWHFAPTSLNKLNLIKEGIEEEKILVTGNTVIDSLLLAKNISENEQPAIGGLPNQEVFNGNTRIVLITGHRRENFGEGMANICNAIRDLADLFPDVYFVYPVHLNPNVRNIVYAILGDFSASRNVYLIEPLSYLPFVFLMSKSYLILTDSGGIQEEAPSLGKPVLVMRDTTERPEAVSAGAVKLIGTSRERIVFEVSLLLENPEQYQMMSSKINPYGDGRASKRIADFIESNI
jgi:UDP-N-acetylglucosamine 2-epimerase (non-hydrolysing)